MARPISPDPKHLKSIRMRKDAIERLSELGEGSIQKGFDILIKCALSNNENVTLIAMWYKSLLGEQDD